MGVSSLHHQERIQQECECLQIRKRVLTKNQIDWHLDLELSNLQNSLWSM